MFHKLRSNIAIPPILVPSVKHNCHYNHIQSIHTDAVRCQFFSVVSDSGISFHTICQLSHLLSHFVLQPSSGSHPNSGTNIQTQVPGACFKILFIFSVLLFYLLSVVLKFLFLLYLCNV